MKKYLSGESRLLSGAGIHATRMALIQAATAIPAALILASGGMVSEAVKTAAALVTVVILCAPLALSEIDE